MCPAPAITFSDVQVLLEKGASCEVRDRKYHMTPADWAKKYKK
jgi:hypothetical protein